MQIVDALERRGVRCWIAPRDVGPGKPFDDEIADAIEASWAMLLIFSERCNESEYIRREVTVAGESHKVIIPFRIEDAQPKRGLRVRLSDLHWIDAFVSRERAIDEVMRTVQPPQGKISEPLSVEPAGQPLQADKALLHPEEPSKASAQTHRTKWAAEPSCAADRRRRSRGARDRRPAFGLHFAQLRKLQTARKTENGTAAAKITEQRNPYPFGTFQQCRGDLAFRRMVATGASRSTAKSTSPEVVATRSTNEEAAGNGGLLLGALQPS